MPKKYGHIIGRLTAAARGAPRHDQRRVVWGVYDEMTRRGVNTYPACIRIHVLPGDFTMVFKFVKTAGMFSMRHSHQDSESTWNTTWFSAIWRQRVSSTVTATNAAFAIASPMGTACFICIMASPSWHSKVAPVPPMCRLTLVSTIMTQSKTGDRLFTAAPN